MSDRDDFLTWVQTALYDAERREDGEWRVCHRHGDTVAQ